MQSRRRFKTARRELGCPKLPEGSRQFLGAPEPLLCAMGVACMLLGWEEGFRLASETLALSASLYMLCCVRRGASLLQVKQPGMAVRVAGANVKHAMPEYTLHITSVGHSKQPGRCCLHARVSGCFFTDAMDHCGACAFPAEPRLVPSPFSEVTLALGHLHLQLAEERRGSC